MDAFTGILRAHRENVHVNFHCGVCATLIFCYKKWQFCIEDPLQISRFFSVTRMYVHVGWDVFIYLGFYVNFNTVQVISRREVGRAEETYSSIGFCTVNCRQMASNYQLSHLRLCWGSNPGLRGGRRECYHSATVAPRMGCKRLNIGFDC